MDLGLLLGTGWASGVNLYAAAALLGIGGRADWLDAGALENPAVIAVAIGMYVVEFFADKIPFVDNTWDAIHTIIRPLGAAMLGATLVGVEQDVTSWAQGSAALGTAGVAFASHAVKATTRLALNASPEPVTNVAASVAEDALVAGVIALAIANPLIAAVVVVVLLVAGIALAVGLWRLARTAREQLRRRRDARRARA